MSGPHIGIVGAYGATGAVVAQTLAAQGIGPLTLIGRNPAKLDELAATLGGSVTVTAADVMDDAALRRACEPCHTVVNCAGPASVILDRVGHVALACGCHYLDPCGDDRVLEGLTARNADVEAKGLRFLLGAGYVPGLSELLVRAIYEVHRGKTAAPCKVRLFVVDRNEWSLSGFVDIIERICRNPPEIGVYRRGVFERRSMLTAWTRRKMPRQSRSEVLVPVRWFEIEPFVREAKPLTAAVYLPIEPSIYFISRLFERVAPNHLHLAARIAQAAFKRKAKRVGTGGILFAEAGGRLGKQPLRWYIEVPEGRHYERTGQVAALATALVADGTIGQSGVRVLAQAVDPHDFIVRLLHWGIETIDVGAAQPAAQGSAMAGTR